MSSLPCGWFTGAPSHLAHLSTVELLTVGPPVTASGYGGAGGVAAWWGAGARAAAYAEPLDCAFTQLFQRLPALAWAGLLRAPCLGGFSPPARWPLLSPGAPCWWPSPCRPRGLAGVPARPSPWGPLFRPVGLAP